MPDIPAQSGDDVFREESSFNGKAVVLVAHGSTSDTAHRAYENVERLVKNHFKGVPVRWAYTSVRVRNELKKREIRVAGVAEAISALVNEESPRVVVAQPLLMTTGSEWVKMTGNLEEFKRENPRVVVVMGSPMLTTTADVTAFSDALLKCLPRERERDDAVVLMGHGNRQGLSDEAYLGVERVLKIRDERVFVATLEGAPRFSLARSEIRLARVKKAFLLPMMVAAGGHAMNDLAGEAADSWKSILESDGVACVPVLKGLCEYDRIAGIFVQHLTAAFDLFEKDEKET